jgi:hypothetical protein
MMLDICGIFLRTNHGRISKWPVFRVRKSCSTSAKSYNYQAQLRRWNPVVPNVRWKMLVMREGRGERRLHHQSAG